MYINRTKIYIYIYFNLKQPLYSHSLLQHKVPHKVMMTMCLLKSARSVQISILEPKIYPRNSKN